MPERTMYVQPEEVARWHGVVVVRTYKNNDAEYPYDFWFTTEAVIEAFGEYECPAFDIREAPTSKAAGLVPFGPALTIDAIKKAVRAALRDRWIVQWQTDTLKEA